MKFINSVFLLVGVCFLVACSQENKVVDAEKSIKNIELDIDNMINSSEKEEKEKSAFDTFADNAKNKEW